MVTIFKITLIMVTYYKQKAVERVSENLSKIYDKTNVKFQYKFNTISLQIRYNFDTISIKFQHNFNTKSVQIHYNFITNSI